ncbi:MAG: GGDEF domain-containing protein [Actinomycetota bacterium]
MTLDRDRLVAAASLLVAACVAASTATVPGVAAALGLSVAAGLVGGGLDGQGRLLYPAPLVAPVVAASAEGAAWAAGVLVAPLLVHVAIAGHRRPLLAVVVSGSASVVLLDGADRRGGALALLAVVLAAELVLRVQRHLHEEGREQRHKADELGTLLHVTDVLAALDDDDRAAEAIGGLGIEILGGVAAAVLVRHEGLQLLWSGGEPELGGGALEGAVRRVATRAIGAARPVLASDDLIEASGLAALHAVPLVASGRPIAVVVVAQDREPTEDDELSVAVFAEHGGRALERILSLQRIADAALRDPLTGVANRRALDALLRQLRPGDAIALLDLDHFKAINDADGHVAGDQVLVTFARHLRRSTGAHDVVGRWGGEEFLIVLRGAHHQALDRVEAIAESWRETSPRTTFSAGVALSGRGITPDRLLAEADLALYRAKRAGRDEVCLHGDLEELVEGTPSGSAQNHDN